MSALAFRVQSIIGSIAASAPYYHSSNPACIRWIFQRVQVLNNFGNWVVLGFRVLVIIVQVLGKYMMIRYLDPSNLGQIKAN